MGFEIKRVGVIGAGQMGNGIAHVCSIAGYDVSLNDMSTERIQLGLATINGNMTRQVNKGTLPEADRVAALARIQAAENLDALSDCDLVIEAATENEQVKRKIFQQLCPVLKPEALLATNTSSISITRLAATTDRPEKFVGVHFMNPVPVMQLVELVRGIATDDHTFDLCKAFVLRLGKISTVAEDFPAFIVNRILLPMINEAIYTLYEGVGSVDAIDTAMRLGANHPMGPAAARRLHRPRHLPVDHAGALRGAGGQQVPSVPAAGEVRRGRLARSQDPARLLRLSRREARSDPLSATRSADDDGVRTPPGASRVSGPCFREIPA